LIVGFMKANPANLKPFLPYGEAWRHLQNIGIWMVAVSCQEACLLTAQCFCHVAHSATLLVAH
jgi:hypothetical protein